MVSTIGFEFAEYFKAIHGYDPFPWQRRLAEQVLSEKCWPEIIELPTGCGKTSVLDIGLFTLAKAPEHFPRRIVLVVDRRIIVDQAADHARKLLKQLTEKEDPSLKDMAAGLRHLWNAPEDAPPFTVAVMRGGMPRDEAWAKRPDQPMVALSTVDQVGSRLLFGGYGLSDSMAPIHAGLLGNDTLFLLDEVHLSVPFAETLAALKKRWRNQSAVRLPDRFHFVRMSATPGTKQEVDKSFSLSDEDRNNERLQKRLTAAKPVELKELRVTGKDELDKKGQLAAFCASRAMDFVRVGHKAVVIIVNRVETARLARECLAEKQFSDAVLLTGRMRPLDRESVLEPALLERISTGKNRWSDHRPLIVVATQCVEAGADFDFDAIVTECASLDALKQRFGRLDRLGDDGSQTPGKVKGCIIIRSDQSREASTDPVYGNALARTWQWLISRESPVGFGIEELPSLDDDELEQLVSPSDHAPVLLPAHLDNWCQTRPRPWPQPEIGLWLHGMAPPNPEVQIIWRADLTADWVRAAKKERKELEEINVLLSVCPPGTPEAMSLPLHAARKWIKGDGAVDSEIADVVGAGSGGEDDSRKAASGFLVVRWGSDGASIVGPEEVKPGDTLVVPAASGGIRWGNWDPSSHEEVVDLGDVVQWRLRAKPTLRLHPEVVKTWCPDVLPPPRVPDDNDPDADPKEEIASWLARLPNELQPPWPDILDCIRKSHRRMPIPHDHWVLWARPVKHTLAANDIASGAADEESFIEQEISLEEHCRHVEAFAEKFAENIGLDASIAGDLALAARLHDTGKADPRFQLMLTGGSEVRLAALDRPIAKSRISGRDVRSREEARIRAGYPKGYRHELLGLAMIENCPGLIQNAADPELVLHLIAAHHGHCRPFAPAIEDPAPVDVTLRHGEWELSASSAHGYARLDSGICDRFWSLTEKYGWWGLAWLEAVIRLADHRASEMEENNR